MVIGNAIEDLESSTAMSNLNGGLLSVLRVYTDGNIGLDKTYIQRPGGQLTFELTGNFELSIRHAIIELSVVRVLVERSSRCKGDGLLTFTIEFVAKDMASTAQRGIWRNSNSTQRQSRKGKPGDEKNLGNNEHLSPHLDRLEHRCPILLM